MKPFLLLVLLVRIASAEIKVHESGGVTADPGGGTPAVVTFASPDKVTVRQITSESQAVATYSTGASATAVGDTSRVLCTTPCKLEMPSGPMRIRFGDANPMNANKPIDFNFRPGENSYRVKPFNHGKFATGFLLAVVGGSALITCGILGIVQESTPMLVLGGVGGAVMIGGFVMTSGAKADAVPMRDPSIR